ncbi:MAG: CapA family protein [Paludibacter sp.]|nr:CapA family protein [Paludibacter sp.]
MIRILIAGDFCPPADVVFEAGHDKILGDFSSMLKETDFNVVNLECPVAEPDNRRKIVKSGPHLRCSSLTIDFLHKSGFNLLTLANNHFYDYGNSGVQKTLSECENVGINYVGGGNNITETSTPFFQEIKGKKIAFLNFCENEFSIATSTNGGSNPLDPISNYYQIQKAKTQADYVIVIIHGGNEHYQLPNPRMQKTYRFFANAGADAIINHHQHCFSGYEIYNNTPIFYGLGNFCFEGTKNSIWNEGYAVELIIEETVSFKLHPYLQCNTSEFVIQTLTNEQKKSFETKIDNLNKKICDESALNTSFIEYSKAMSKKYMSLYEPYNCKYLRAFYKRFWLPSFIKKNRFIEAFNAINCESHYDVLRSVFNSFIQKYSKR